MENEQSNFTENLVTKETLEAILLCSDVFIRAQVKKSISAYSSFAQKEIQDLEIDEVIQRVRIKFWRRLQKETIRSPRAYVRSIIYSEIIDALRRQKVTQALPIDESDEYHEALKLSDSADEIIHQMTATCLLHEVVRLILELPPRQKLAMICQLQDQVDNPRQLIDAFKRYQIDIESLHWPTEKAEKQLLRASLSAARRSLARSMRERLQNIQYTLTQYA